MDINSEDIVFLKQLDKVKKSIKDINNLNLTQIKYRLKKINYLFSLLNYPEIVLDDLGYIISEKKSIEYILSNFDGLTYSKEARLNHIIMLFLKQNYVGKKEIQDFLQCSISTIKNDFLEFKKKLKRFNVSLKYIHKSGFILDGSEKKIRDFFLNYYMLNFNVFKKNIILKESEPIVFSILKGCNSSFETSKIISILLAIQYYRISCKNYIDHSSIKTMLFFDSNLNNKHSYVNLIIENDYNLEFENIYFELYLNNLIYNKIKPSRVKNNIFFDSLELFIKNVGNTLDMKLLQDNKLKKGLNNHIQSLLFKKDNFIPINKDDLNSFKEEFYDLYRAVYDQSKIFKDNFKVNFVDGDLLYISYHFLSAINRLNKKKIKKVLIVCNKGIGASKILEEKLKLLFLIEVVDNISYYEYQLYNLKNIDIIIHTIDNIQYNLKNIKVSPLISKIDEEKMISFGFLRK